MMKSHVMTFGMCLTASLMGLWGCSDDEGAAATTGDTPTCADYSGASGDPSFADDVMPIFQLSCNFSSCHSSVVGNPQEGLALGPPNGETADQATLDAVIAGIVDQPASQSSLNLVESGDPAASWLMAKVEYQDAEFQTCNVPCDGDCGDRMPQNSPKLPDASRATLAAWIAAGANNN